MVWWKHPYNPYWHSCRDIKTSDGGWVVQFLNLDVFKPSCLSLSILPFFYLLLYLLLCHSIIISLSLSSCCQCISSIIIHSLLLATTLSLIFLSFITDIHFLLSLFLSLISFSCTYRCLIPSFSCFDYLFFPLILFLKILLDHIALNRDKVVEKTLQSYWKQNNLLCWRYDKIYPIHSVNWLMNNWRKCKVIWPETWRQLSQKWFERNCVKSTFVKRLILRITTII